MNNQGIHFLNNQQVYFYFFRKFIWLFAYSIAETQLQFDERVPESQTNDAVDGVSASGPAPEIRMAVLAWGTSASFRQFPASRVLPRQERSNAK